MTDQPTPRNAPDIIVIGASAGGVPALSEIVHALPRDLPAAVFVVLHIARDGSSALAPLLDRISPLPIRTAVDCSAIETGTVCVAPQDRHMTLEPERVRVSFGPLQNRNRPSIDVLFRSAALSHGPRVIGVVLTGFLSDGTAGLLAIKQRGGVAVVQDPDSALFPDMPSNALRAVQVDHCVPLAQIANLLVRLTAPSRSHALPDPEPPSLVQRFEADADLGKMHDLEKVSEPSSFLCPDCGGVLWELSENGLPKFRCRVGHGYSAETLQAGQDEAVERALWAAARSLEDRAALSRHLAEVWRNRQAPAVLDHFLRQAERSSADASVLRSILGVPPAQGDR